MAINLERFYDEFAAEYVAKVGVGSPFLEPGRRALWMVCTKNFELRYAIKRMAEKFLVPEKELMDLVSPILPDEYHIEVAEHRKRFWSGKGKKK